MKTVISLVKLFKEVELKDREKCGFSCSQGGATARVTWDSRADSDCCL